jgi:DNA-binding MarR family transcriptional regulator
MLEEAINIGPIQGIHHPLGSWTRASLIFSIPDKESVQMGMLDLIDKLINEHGSSTILKERLELLKDQISILEKENDAVKSENATLKTKASAIESQLNMAREEIERLNQVIVGLKEDHAKIHLDAVTEKVLKVFFDAGRELSVNEIAATLSIDISTAQYHFDVLSEKDLIQQTRVGFVSPRAPKSAPQFSLTPSGREYVIKNIRR